MNTRNRFALIELLLLPLLCTAAHGGTALPEKRLHLQGLPTENEVYLNISAITMSADRTLMVVGADEESAIQILTRTSDVKYELVDDGNFSVAPYTETELDIEGIARNGKRFWIIGSHSLKRKSIKAPGKLDADADEDYNHERMATIVPEPTREWLYLLKIGNDGKVDADRTARGSLRTIFANHPLLSRFTSIPSKENGIDIEGLTLIPDPEDKDDATLLVGLRGPVLRGPRAIVLVVKAKRKGSELKLKLEDTRYLALDGRGIRGMSRIDDSGERFLVLAGPVGDAPVSYMVYHWNGEDTIPEIRDPNAENNVRPLCEIEIPRPTGQDSAKAEGIHVLEEDRGKIRFVIVYDSVENGGATQFSCDLGSS
jgi:hypothetical protein